MIDPPGNDYGEYLKGLEEKEMADKKIAGMYQVEENPDFHRVVVGNFTICRQNDNSVWIRDGEEEGGDFPDALFEKCIREFFNKHF